MLRLKAKSEHAQDAITLAKSFQLVHYRNSLYVPVHFETGEINALGDPVDSCWETVSSSQLQRIAAAQFSTLFGSDSELRNFYFMVEQASQHVDNVVDSLLVRTEAGLRRLDNEGVLQAPSGEFVPNAIKPMLNEHESAKQMVYDTIVQWLGSEEEAVSLLHHLATVLAPGWSAVKYVMLLGEGRNGKGVLLGMLKLLFGEENMSMVPRQEIAKRTPMVLDLNGKLINMVMDGSVEYIKDSGTEKTLVAGEPAYIKDLYKAAPVVVQTNALFVEALNKEPLSRDKSSALQKRLARFYFNNVYESDLAFQAKMWRDSVVGAFLALLIDYYVKSEETAEKLRLTEASQLLQIEHMFVNSHGLQFLKAQLERDSSYSLVGFALEDIAEQFLRWKVTLGDSSWELADAMQTVSPLVICERKSQRSNGKVRKVKVATEYRPEVTQFLDSVKGDIDENSVELFDAMVED